MAKRVVVQVKNLPAPAPGQVVTVPLEMWAEYRDLHGLAVEKVEWLEGKLWVRVRKDLPPNPLPEREGEQTEERTV